MVPLAFPFEPVRREYTVAALTEEMGALLAEAYAGIWVSGEVSQVKLSTSGHYYFTLKDDKAQIRCACFKNKALRLRVKPQDGMAVLARGSVEVYGPRGEYQLIVEAVEPRGLGALQAAFEALKKRLAAEGLFEQARKRPPPRMPRRIGIVTSPDGAAVRDMVSVLTRRFPGVHIRLYPALVQGEGSVEQVWRGIDYFSTGGWADVVIVGRGGGSLEDLWTFNEEAVARAIFESTVPLVSAVGHETDFTIADFVADLRAPTPSAAAELVVPLRSQIFEHLASQDARILRAARLRISRASERLYRQGVERARTIVSQRIRRYAQRVDTHEYALREQVRRRIGMNRLRADALAARLRRLDLRLRLRAARVRLDASTARLESSIERRIASAMARLDRATLSARQLSPLNVLERGYAIVENARGVVRDAAEAPPRSEVSVRLRRGALKAQVTESVEE